jgi:hypothetical protein
MKKSILIVLSAVALLTMAAATGCTSSYASSDQVMYLQNQVNSLNSSLNSTQQELASAKQQLQSTQQSLTDAQAKRQQNRYVTGAQPGIVYPPVVVYRGYNYSTPWHPSPTPFRPPQPYPYPHPQPLPHPAP